MLIINLLFQIGLLDLIQNLFDTFIVLLYRYVLISEEYIIIRISQIG
jgi:hypothetical protein